MVKIFGSGLAMGKDEKWIIIRSLITGTQCFKSLTLFLIVFFCILGIHAAYPLILKRLQSRKTDKIGPERVADSTRNSTFKIEDPNQPFISIIIPVYNEELVIERRLNNIFESTYPKDSIEVFVVDDGSTDKTSAIVQEKYPNEVILLREPRRRGKAQVYLRLGATCTVVYGLYPCYGRSSTGVCW